MQSFTKRGKRLDRDLMSAWTAPVSSMTFVSLTVSDEAINLSIKMASNCKAELLKKKEDNEWVNAVTTHELNE